METMDAFAYEVDTPIPDLRRGSGVSCGPGIASTRNRSADWLIFDRSCVFPIFTVPAPSVLFEVPNTTIELILLRSERKSLPFVEQGRL